MSCHNQGANAAGGELPFEVCAWLDDSGTDGFSFLQALAPRSFTRKELQEIRDRMRDLLARTIISEVKREFMECLVDDLDMLDALEAREEVDLAELEEHISEHSQPATIRITISGEPHELGDC